MSLDTAVVTVKLSDAALAKVNAVFSNVYYCPDGKVPEEALAKVQIWLSPNTGIDNSISIEQLPKLKIVQAMSAGVQKLVGCASLASPGGRAQVSICSASGIHSYAIPQYIVAMTVNVYMRIGTQVTLTKTLARWPSRPEMLHGSTGKETNLASYTIHGKTVGLLGYGHIARETARLFKAFNLNVIAANSSGKRAEDDGYIVPGTGDRDGSIPSEIFSTSDPASFKSFLSQTDILVASLPSTPKTQYMLTAEHLGLLRPAGVFINVGRGDLIKSEEILKALDAKSEHEGLFGCALDVTDPEPLTAGSPLYTHPRVLITPHTSGDFYGYNDAATELMLANAEQLKKGERLYNVVDPEKGY